MAQVLSDSIIGYPEALALFSKPIQNIGVKKNRYINHYPINDFTTQGVIQFHISGNGSSYIDLSKTILNLRCKIVKRDGSDISEAKRFTGIQDKPVSEESTPTEKQIGGSSGAAGDSAAADDSGETQKIAGRERRAVRPKFDGIVGVANNFMNSIFSRVDVSLQNKLMTDSDNLYPYQAYLKTLLYTPKELKDTALQMQLYYPDKYGVDKDHDNNIIHQPKASYYIPNWVSTSNPNLRTRSEFFNKSNEVDLCGALCSDLFDLQRYILNGVSINITLYPSSPEFCLLSPDLSPSPDYKVVVTRAVLQVSHVEVSPEILAAHSEILETENAVYHYTKSEVKKFTLSKGIFSTEINNPFESRVPSELIIGIVKGQASHGHYHNDPFYFETIKLSNIQVTCDGEDLTNSPMEVKYNEYYYNSLYLDAYKALSGVQGPESEIPMSRADFFNGYTLYRFVSQQEDNSTGNDVVPLRRTGDLRISLKFDEQLNETMTVIVLARFPSGFVINKNRGVYEI